MAVECVCLLAQEHVKFRIPELHSIASIHGINLSHDGSSEKISPFLKLKMPNLSCCQQILERSMTVRYILELWGSGSSVDELVRSLNQYPPDKMEPYRNTTFRINIETYNKKISQGQKQEYIKVLSFLPLDGKVNLNNPEHEFSLLLDFGDDNNAATDKPCQLFFGRLIGQGQRHLLKKFSLKTRHFIGNTSMDPLLSFLMANQGKARPGTLIFDPFVGTGSILLACAHFGGHVIGSDIDKNLVQGRGKSSRANCKWKARDEVMRTNFRQAGLEQLFVDAIIADASRSVLRATPIFDAIITDPPYGVREGVRKLKADNNSVDTPYPAIKLGRLSDVIISLLHFASCYLTLHGRLVFWLPVHRQSYDDGLLPLHPCLALVANSEQTLFRHISRRLITMEKIRPHQTDVTLERLTEQNIDFQSMCDSFRDNYFSSPS
ncbi:tRNA (guanine(10)-N2)-methyltransferase homolog isoform X1 [Nematostella vectensis]|uniref:tRNA (guanine(10)-N2)-methyltransferase homolog isoform X1 n=1 Tax=Nematostella vectensis TaxID=45351 RepID=UPI0020770AD4|nr:tRNA (guanine(10)-N2)-methyltransferase homolog isoform X1 [Nematostella vectensis]